MTTSTRLLMAFAILFCSAQMTGQATQKKSAASTGNSSGYRTGVGLRFGSEGGLTVKHFIGKNAIEGIFSRGWGYGGFRITGLYEIQKPIASTQGLAWFFGFGAHIGFYNGRYYGYNAYNGGYYDKHGNWHPQGYRSNYMTLGVDGILGLEYLFAEVPLTLSLDIKPYIDLIGWGNRFADGALSIRYAIK